MVLASANEEKYLVFSRVNLEVRFDVLKGKVLPMECWGGRKIN